MICVGFMCGDEVPLPARYCSAVSAKVPGRVGEPAVKPLSSQDKVSCAQKKVSSSDFRSFGTRTFCNEKGQKSRFSSLEITRKSSSISYFHHDFMGRRLRRSVGCWWAMTCRPWCFPKLMVQWCWVVFVMHKINQNDTRWLIFMNLMSICTYFYLDQQCLPDLVASYSQDFVLIQATDMDEIPTEATAWGRDVEQEGLNGLPGLHSCHIFLVEVRAERSWKVPQWSIYILKTVSGSEFRWFMSEFWGQWTEWTEHRSLPMPQVVGRHHGRQFWVPTRNRSSVLPIWVTLFQGPSNLCRPLFQLRQQRAFARSQTSHLCFGYIWTASSVVWNMVLLFFLVFSKHEGS